MTKRDRYSVQTDDEQAAPFPTAEKIFQGRAPIIPRREDTEALKQQVTQLQEELARRANGLAIQGGALVVDGFQFSPTGLIAPETIEQAAWENVGALLFRLEGSIQWLIGDWLVYGEGVHYGELEQFAEEIGREYKTLRNYMVVCRAIDLSRRRDNVSWGHHEAVTKYEADVQDYCLAYAEEHSLSRAEFRRWLKQGMPEKGLIEQTARPSLSDRIASDSPVIKAVESYTHYYHVDPDAADHIQRRQAIDTYYQMAQSLEEYRRKWKIE
jgi:hypothetical protein